MADVRVNNPNSIRIPKKFRNDPETMAFFRQQQIFLNDLYRRSGGEVDRAQENVELIEEVDGLAQIDAEVGVRGRVEQAAAVEDLSLSPSTFSKSATASVATTTAAPASYDQTQIQELVDAVEDLKASQASIVTDLSSIENVTGSLAGDITSAAAKANEILTASRDAGQMESP